MVKRYLCALLVVVIAACAFVFPASAAVVGYAYICPRCGEVIEKQVIGTAYYCDQCGASLELLGGGGGYTRGGGAGRSQGLYYYTQPVSGSTGSTPSYATGTTKYYQVDNTTNKTLNFTTWNQQTNNYTYNSYTYNNYTYNNEYNYYTYDIDNHYYYVTYNVNYVNIIYPDGTQDEDGNDNYDSVNIFYKLPDGRNSYDLNPDDIYGTYFVYNVVPYQSIPEDDGVTLGLWHLDGDLKDSSANNGKYMLTSSMTTFVDVDDTWNQALRGIGEFSLDGPIDFSSDPFTLEFRIYVSSSEPYVYLTGLHTATLSFYALDTWRGYLRIPSNQWNTISFCFNGGSFFYYVNGVKSNYLSLYLYNNSVRSWVQWSNISQYVNTNVTYTFDPIMDLSVYGDLPMMVDEIRLSNKSLYSGPYVISSQPFDTNLVLVPPVDPVEYDIGIFSVYDVPEYRIGGVRPTYPTDGFVWVYLEDDVVQSVQQYQTDGWYSVDARIYVDDTWQDVKGFNLNDAKFEEPPAPEPTPTPMPDPGGPDPTPDPGGETPSPSPGGDEDTEIDTSEPGWFDKFLSLLFDGLVGLFQTIGVVLGSLLTGIVSLLTQVVSGLSQIVGLGGDFTGVIGGLFSWLPPEMQLVIVSGFTVFIFAGLLKLFL